MSRMWFGVALEYFILWPCHLFRKMSILGASFSKVLILIIEILFNCPSNVSEDLPDRYKLACGHNICDRRIAFCDTNDDTCLTMCHQLCTMKKQQEACKYNCEFVNGYRSGLSDGTEYHLQDLVTPISSMVLVPDEYKLSCETGICDRRKGYCNTTCKYDCDAQCAINKEKACRRKCDFVNGYKNGFIDSKDLSNQLHEPETTFTPPVISYDTNINSSLSKPSDNNVIPIAIPSVFVCLLVGIVLLVVWYIKKQRNMPQYQQTSNGLSVSYTAEGQNNTDTTTRVSEPIEEQGHPTANNSQISHRSCPVVSNWPEIESGSCDSQLYEMLRSNSEDETLQHNCVKMASKQYFDDYHANDDRNPEIDNSGHSQEESLTHIQQASKRKRNSKEQDAQVQIHLESPGNTINTNSSGRDSNHLPVLPSGTSEAQLYDLRYTRN